MQNQWVTSNGVSLRDPGSLTQQLVEASQGAFTVQCLQQTSILEGQLCGGALRQVCLRGHGEPWVYARSILTPLAFERWGVRLVELGEQPLGMLLFEAGSGVRRGPFRFQQVPATHPRVAEAIVFIGLSVKSPQEASERLWVIRHSQFLEDAVLGRVLVDMEELFLPSLKPYLMDREC